MELSKLIDHTLLKQNARQIDIIKLAEEAKKYNFASVCVNPAWVETAAQILKDTDVKVCTVIGFPLGASTTKTKVFEAKDAAANGASEVDMVINIGALKEGRDAFVKEEIDSVVKAVKGKAIVKVIIETCLLTDDEKVRACRAAMAAGADFVKTSTGFSTDGAKVEDVKLMRETVGEKLGVKASGGIRTKEDLEKFVEAGATRIGTSAGIKIVMQNYED